MYVQFFEQKKAFFANSINLAKVVFGANSMDLQ